MVFKQYFPSLPLARYINKIQVMEFDHIEYVGKIVPYGEAEVIFRFGDPYVLLDKNNEQIIPEFAIAGQLEQYIKLKPSGKTGSITVDFKPYGIWHFLKVPMDELTGKIIDAKDIFKKSVEKVLEQINENSIIDEKAGIVEKFFMDQLPVNNVDIVDKMCDEIIEKKGLISITDLVKEYEVSHTTFKRRFKQKVGVSPKFYSRIRRYNYIYKLMTSQPGFNWQRIVEECKYFDQAHFIKEFHEFSGESPSSFFSKENFFSSFFSGK